MRVRPALRRLQWLTARPIAHRGLHDIAGGVVENTASAFARAIEHDYAIECDLQLAADGEIMVFHDDTLDRLTDHKGPLAALSAKALRAVAFKSGGDRIPTLREVLELVGGRVPLVIEIKSEWNGESGLVLGALKVLESYRGPHCIMSFDPDILEAARATSPRTIRGIVADRVMGSYYDKLPLARRLEMRYFTHVPRTEPDFISYHWSDLPFPFVSEFRNAGHSVICWTVRSPEAAAKALQHADQITFEGFLP